jgi:predicted nucleic acid-binding protein
VESRAPTSRRRQQPKPWSRPERLFTSSSQLACSLAIALDLRHPVYGCFYLALAEARSSRLVTTDDRLLRVCARAPFAKLVRSL